MKVIHHTFGPLADVPQVLRALAMLLCPWVWKRGKSEHELERALTESLGGEAITFASGREALFALLKALKLRSGEEVILPAFTCVVVPNAIHATGGVAVFADIDEETLQSGAEEVARRITPRTRAILCQHTFGIPADMTGLRQLCDERKLILIEDSAHMLPCSRGPAGLARMGHFTIASFGRDKAISGVSGGAVLSRNSEISEKLRSMQADAASVPMHRIARLLLYPLLYALARPMYSVGLGKALLAASKQCGILIPILTIPEKNGHMSPMICRMPNALAFLALQQFRDLPDKNDHRRRLTAYYLDAARAHGWNFPNAITADLPLQKFPLFFVGAEQIRKKLKEKNIYLEDGWTNCVICPSSSNLAAAGYEPGNDPQAEETCARILSLPTHPGMNLRQAKRLLGAMQGLIDH